MVVTGLRFAVVCRKLANIRHLSSQVGALRVSEVILYKWPGMRYLQMFSRIKFAQAAVAMVSMIPLSKGYIDGSVEGSTLALAGGGAVIISGIFFGVSAILQRFIGRITLSQKENEITISTISFWGRRTDLRFNVNDIVPFSDSNRDHSLFHRLEITGADSSYIYSLRFGYVMDKKLLDIFDIVNIK